MEKERVALDMVLHVQDDHPEKRLKNSSFFASKWTMALHHGVGYASLNTHLQSFDSPIPMEEEWPSLETPT